MEQVFYDCHSRVGTSTLRYTSHRFRTIIEHIILFTAVSTFCSVILSHRTFVSKGGAIKSEAKSHTGWNIPSMCFKHLKGFRDDVDVTHVIIVHHDDYHYKKSHNDGGTDIFNSVVYTPFEFEQYFSSSSTATCNSNIMTRNKEHNNNFLTQHLQMNTKKEEEQNNIHSSTSSSFNHGITYSFSSSKGYVYLDPLSLSNINISSQYVIISSTDRSCFSDDPLLLKLVHKFSAIRDTIALNWILGYMNGRNGFIYKHRTGKLIDLERYLREYLFQLPPILSTSSTSTSSRKAFMNNIITSFSSLMKDTIKNKSTISSSSDNININSNSQNFRWHHHYFIFKVGVLLSSLFLFFLTTTLVSFTLRETQDRMLNFTFALSSHIRNRRPFASLVITHVVENMVFVPIMIGTFFFLGDCFYDGDRILAFIIFSGVWVCEVFSVISMRTIHSSIYFPQVFFAYFTLFHCYYFSCPFGFSYEALLSTVLFQLHAMVFFWNRYELPALACGQVSRHTQRMVYPSNEYVMTHQTNGGGVSYMSMSSLGRINSASSSQGLYQSDENYSIFMNGEVVLQNGRQS